MGVSVRPTTRSASDLEVLRLRLLIEMANQRVRLCRLTSDFEAMSAPPHEKDGLERGRLALQLYETQDFIEETEEALVRLIDGRYGVCESCKGDIRLERLKAIPQARLCAACFAVMASSPAGLQSRAWPSSDLAGA